MKRQVIYWRGSGDLQLELIKEFKNRGCVIKHARTIGDLIKLISICGSVLVIADGTGSSAEASNKLNELIKAKELYNYPIIFVSKDAHAKVVSLRAHYSQILPVNTPFRADAIFHQVSELTKNDLADVDNEIAIDITSDGQEHLSEIAEELKDRNQGWDGNNVSISNANNLNAFDDHALVPEHPKRELLRQVLNRMTELHGWSGLHVRRVMSLSSKVAQELSLESARNSNLQVSALSLNWGLVQDEDEMFEGVPLKQIDFVLNNSPDVLNLLADGFERSALFIRERLDDDIAARTVMVVATLMRKDLPEESSEIIEDAQLTMFNEMTDRACWSRGFWDPYGAYRILRLLGQENQEILSDSVSELMTRIMVEAISQKSTLLGVSLPDHTLAAATHRAELAVMDSTENITKVALVDLKVGMELIAPLYTSTGRMVVQSNLILDDDLINRLWQLSAVNALKGPFRVR